MEVETKMNFFTHSWLWNTILSKFNDRSLKSWAKKRILCYCVLFNVWLPIALSLWNRVCFLYTVLPTVSSKSSNFRIIKKMFFGCCPYFVLQLFQPTKNFLDYLTWEMWMAYSKKTHLLANLIIVMISHKHPHYLSKPWVCP